MWMMGILVDAAEVVVRVMVVILKMMVAPRVVMVSCSTLRPGQPRGL